MVVKQFVYIYPATKPPSNNRFAGTDVSQMTADKDARPKLVMSCGSGRDSEETLEKLLLADHIALRQPPDLALANDVHRLVPRDRAQGPSADRKP